MKNNSFNVRNMAELSLFAALIYLSIQVFKIPVGPQFIHLGNALVVIGVLIFGSRNGFIAGAIGLGIYDILNGYVAEVWITILEALIVVIVLHFLYEGAFNREDKLRNIIMAALAAAVTKIFLNLLKYTLTAAVFGNVSLGAAFIAAVAKIMGTFGTSLVTIIAVPLLYPLFRPLVKK